MKLVGTEGGMICPPCFNALCEDAGIAPCWRVMTLDDWDGFEEALRRMAATPPKTGAEHVPDTGEMVLAPDGTVTFPEGNDYGYGQDHGFYRGVPAGVSFTPTPFVEDKVKLVARGYGQLGHPFGYGNGALYLWGPGAERLLAMMAATPDSPDEEPNTKST